MMIRSYVAAQSLSQLRLTPADIDKASILQTSDAGVEVVLLLASWYTAAAWARLEASVPGRSGELVRVPDSPTAAGPEAPEHTPAPARERREKQYVKAERKHWMR